MRTPQNTLAYYSGNRALECDPTPGTWTGNTFVAVDGSEWMPDPNDANPHPLEDGTGMHYLLELNPKGMRVVRTTPQTAQAGTVTTLGNVQKHLPGGVMIATIKGEFLHFNH